MNRSTGGDEKESTKAGAFALLETYLRDTPILLDERPEGVEVSVELDLARHGLPRLVGIMDLVRKGGYIVDYKTTSRTPDEMKAACGFFNTSAHQPDIEESDELNPREGQCWLGR